MQTGCRYVVHRVHRLNGNFHFRDTVLANHSKMDFSIYGRLVFKDRSPINVPAGEDGTRVACDGEQNWLLTRMLQTCAITTLVDEARHGIVANFESLISPRFSRV